MNSFLFFLSFILLNPRVLCFLSQFLIPGKVGGSGFFSFCAHPVKKVMQASLWKSKPSEPLSVSCQESIPAVLFLPPLSCFTRWRLCRRFFPTGVFVLFLFLNFIPTRKSAIFLSLPSLYRLRNKIRLLLFHSHPSPRYHIRGRHMDGTAHSFAVFFFPDLACIRWIHLLYSISLFPASSHDRFFDLSCRKVG